MTTPADLLAVLSQPSEAEQIASLLESHVAIADRPRQLDRLEALAERVRKLDRDWTGYVSYAAWFAGVKWGAEHGEGEWDDAEQAWAEWADTSSDREGVER